MVVDGAVWVLELYATEDDGVSGPNFLHHCLIVSLEAMISRLARRSSTSLKVKQNL